jgi:hypothetical protein
MARKRQSTPRPGTRVPISDQEMDEVEREAAEQLRRKSRRSALVAHRAAISAVYETYRKAYPDEDRASGEQLAAFRKQLAADKGRAEFDRWLEGGQQGEPPPLLPLPLPPRPRLFAELGKELQRIKMEVYRLETEGCASEEDETAVIHRLLVQRGWSSTQIAEAIIEDPDIDGSKTSELKDTPQARRSRRVSAEFCKQLKAELERVHRQRKYLEQRIGEVGAAAARAEFDGMKAARKHEVPVTSESRPEHQRMSVLALIVACDENIEAMQTKLDELERRTPSQRRKRDR